jgi:hypothetical protein
MGLAVLLLQSTSSDGTVVDIVDGEDCVLVDEICPDELTSCAVKSSHRLHHAPSVQISTLSPDHQAPCLRRIIGADSCHLLEF